MYKIKMLTFDEPFDFDVNEVIKNLNKTKTKYYIDINAESLDDLYNVLKGIGCDTFEKAEEILSDNDYFECMDLSGCLKRVNQCYKDEERLMSYKKTNKLKFWTYLDPLKIHGVFIKDTADSLSDYDSKFNKLSKYGDFVDDYTDALSIGVAVSSDNESEYMEYTIHRSDNDYLTDEDVKNLNKVFYGGDK